MRRSSVVAGGPRRRVGRRPCRVAKVATAGPATGGMQEALTTTRMRTPFRHQAARPGGFTIVEIMIAVVVLGIIGAIAVPIYENYITEARIATAIKDIRQISLILDDRFLDNEPPPTLADVGITLVDPWGNAYQYLWLRGNPAPGLNGQRRRDKSMNPVNTDYDLYSMGPDGLTAAQFVAGQARDDIVRANDGDFVGVAADHWNGVIAMSLPHPCLNVARRIHLSFILAAALPLLLLAVTSYQLVSSRLEQVALDEARQLAKSMGMDVFERLQFITDQLTLVSRHDAAEDALDSTLHDLDLGKRIQGLFHVRASGELTGGPAGRSGPASDRQRGGRRQHRQATAAGDRPGGAAASLPAGVRRGACRPRVRRRGAEPEHLWDTAGVAARPERVCILDMQGSPVFCNHDGYEAWLDNSATLLARRGKPAPVLDGDGERVLTAAWPLFLKPYFQFERWTVVVGVPESMAFAAIRTFDRLFAGVGVIALLTAFVFGRRLTGRNLKPLRTSTRRPIASRPAISATASRCPAVMNSNNWAWPSTAWPRASVPSSASWTCRPPRPRAAVGRRLCGSGRSRIGRARRAAGRKQMRGAVSRALAGAGADLVPVVCRRGKPRLRTAGRTVSPRAAGRPSATTPRSRPRRTVGGRAGCRVRARGGVHRGANAG